MGRPGTLIVMEVVLGIDNLIFIAVLSNKLPEAHRARIQRIGILLALVLRIGLPKFTITSRLATRRTERLGTQREGFRWDRPSGRSRCSTWSSPSTASLPLSA